MRVPDWPQRLYAELKTAERRSFAFGTHDCLQFTARCVEAVTGCDYARGFEYSGELGAHKLLAKHGGVEGLLTLFLGEPIAPNFAREGDIVTANFRDGSTAGVCLGNRCAFARSFEETGLLYVFRTAIVKAWRVD